MQKIRVLVAEDFAPFRHFVCSTLSQRSDLQIVAEVSDGQEAVQKTKELKPDLMLLDVGLPCSTGSPPLDKFVNLSLTPKSSS